MTYQKHLKPEDLCPAAYSAAQIELNGLLEVLRAAQRLASHTQCGTYVPSGSSTPPSILSLSSSESLPNMFHCVPGQLHLCGIPQRVHSLASQTCLGGEGDNKGDKLRGVHIISLIASCL